jgi:DNA-binding transcriptional MerR regulator
MSEMLTSSEAAASLDLPAETIRYWERAGLVQAVARDAARRRRYSAADLEFIEVIRCLRLTGMPVRVVRHSMTTSGGRRTLHLPRAWPWKDQFNTILNRLRSIPRPVVCLRA